MTTTKAATLGLLLLAGVVGPARAQTAAPAGCRVVVLNLAGRNLAEGDRDLPQLLTETLAHEAAGVSGCQVVSQQDVAQMVDYEALRQQCGEGDSCLAEIGAALGADRVVSGTLGRLGADWVLGARLLNVKQGSVEGRAELVVGAVEGLRPAAQNAARQLFGAPPLASTTATPTKPPRDRAAGPSPLFVAGAVTASVGAFAAAGGGALAGIAEAQLGDASTRAKGNVADAGRVALVVAGVGGALLIVGGGLLVADLVVE